MEPSHRDFVQLSLLLLHLGALSYHPKQKSTSSAMKHNLLLIFIILFNTPTYTQVAKRALFLGNSYTVAHNIPGMITDVALSAGDSLIWSSNAPGGYTLQGHSTDAGSLGLIAQGNWDFVVLQEQSQRPSFPLSQVQNEVFPFAAQLNNYINQHNACAETVFYMTWGRKNGDAGNCAAWPPVCTYQGMDSLLRLRYMMMANDNDAIVSPAGAVWRHIRTKYPDIELYEPDESHPSLAGAYAVACSFYTTFFRKSPMLITWDGNLSANDALRIRTAAKEVVMDSLLTWYIGAYDPQAHFSFLSVADSVVFTNVSTNASSYLWDFGDGNNSTVENPVHHYAQQNTYPVTLIASHCDLADTFKTQVHVVGIGFSDNLQSPDITFYPNPASGAIYISGDFIQATLLSVSGQIIRQVYGDKMFNLQGLPSGIYFLEVSTNQGSARKKIILNH
jgi:hypothetical protein